MKVLSAYGIDYDYGMQPVLREVSLELERAQVVALLGPNGSGKSTLLKLLSGNLPLKRRTLHSDLHGQIKYLGQDLVSMTPERRAKNIAYVPAELRADFPITAEEAVMMGRGCHQSGIIRRITSEDRDFVRRAMEECRCWDLRDRELRTLSNGQRQLVVLARSLAQGAKVLLLDESLSGMDLNHQALMGKMLRSLAERGYSIILVSHDINLASEWADACVMLKEGRKIAEGPTQTVLTTQNLLALYPGAALAVEKSPLTGSPKVFFGRA